MLKPMLKLSGATFAVGLPFSAFLARFSFRELRFRSALESSSAGPHFASPALLLTACSFGPACPAAHYFWYQSIGG